MNRKQVIDGLLQRHFGIGIDDTKLAFSVPSTCEMPFEEVNAVYDECDLDRIDVKCVFPSVFPPHVPLTLDDQKAIIEGWEIKEVGR